ncbi:MAG: 4Fe-4S binding protein [Cyanobacteria bacterium J06648_16]
MATIQIDVERCRKCGTCVQICPALFEQDAKGAVPRVLDTARCNASLVCETLKLGAFYTGYVVAGIHYNARLAKLLKLPQGHKIYAGLAIGYPRFRYKHWIERKPAQIQWIEPGGDHYDK